MMGECLLMCQKWKQYDERTCIFDINFINNHNLFAQKKIRLVTYTTTLTVVISK